MSSEGERRPVISNYKISFYTIPNILLSVPEQEEENISYYSNFLVYRKKFVHTLFYSGFANITKIPSYDLIQEAVREFRALAGLKIGEVENYKVDTTTSSGHFGQKLNLRLVRKSLDLRRYDVIFSYKPSKFAGASIKFGKQYSCRRKFGTITVFQSGAFTIVGAKSSERVEEIYELTREILFTNPD